MTTERRPLFALLGANAVSMTGNTVSQVAIPWFVLQTTGSASRTGIVAACVFLPPVLMGILGAGASLREIAEAGDVSPQTVANVCNR